MIAKSVRREAALTAAVIWGATRCEGMSYSAFQKQQWDGEATGWKRMSYSAFHKSSQIGRSFCTQKVGAGDSREFYFLL